MGKVDPFTSHVVSPNYMFLAQGLQQVEVEHEEVDGTLWRIRYPIKGMDRFLVVATTRHPRPACSNTERASSFHVHEPAPATW